MRIPFRFRYASSAAPGGDYTRPLGLWMLATVILNLLLCRTNGYGGDIDYWVNWVHQLQTNGYAKLDANYPPLYIHWLWLIGKLASVLNVPVASDVLLRLLTNAPVLLAQLLLLLLMNQILRHTPVSNRTWNLLIGLAALNPAILVNGPYWGQVDMIFCVMIAALLYLLIEGHWLVCVFPLLAAAILTKFQAICIFPVVLPLLWHRRSKMLYLGILPAIAIAVLLLLPYVRADGVYNMFDRTYIKVASMYPYATYHANNLWYLLGLNTRSDNLFIFALQEPAESWRRFFTPKMLGIALFGVWSILIAISSFLRNDMNVHWRNAFLSALGFFLLLPGMHERYMMPAVVLTLVAAARFPRFMKHAAILTLLSAVNMLIVLPPPDGSVSLALSAVSLAFVPWTILHDNPELSLRVKRFAGAPLKIWVPVLLSIWGIVLLCYLWPRIPETEKLTPDAQGWVDASAFPERTVTQEWGALHIHKSVEGNGLSVAKQHFQKGFGTHAASTIRIPIPSDAVEFSTLVGADDEAAGAEISFIVRVDGVDAWNSGPMHQGDSARSISINITGKKKLELIVDSMGSISGDHADWLQPRIRLKR